MMFLKSSILALALLIPLAATAHAREWNIDIATNDRVGQNWNAHTIREHVGKTEADLRARVARE
jgi:hypothetical protein